ncbi:hypothetical protein PI124_g8474 [Phytophthora idaei]|nr:hypothetical protein PI124_g8474 [Phytophthora idaei]
MPSRQFDPLQCQYPAGCKKERSIKLNGDRDWLCGYQRERQNASARARYRRSTSKKKQKSKASCVSPSDGGCSPTSTILNPASAKVENMDAKARRAPAGEEKKRKLMQRAKKLGTLQESSSHVRSKQNRQPLAQHGPVFAEDGSIKRRNYGDAPGTNGDPSDARQTEEVPTLPHREPRYTTVNAEVSEAAEDGNGSERLPAEVLHCNILLQTLYMLVSVAIEGSLQLPTLAVHENQASGAAI